MQEDPILFPNYISKPTQRMLACLEGNQITTENNQTYTLYSIADLSALLLQENLLLFVESITGLPDLWLDYCIEYGRVWCNKRGTPVSIQFTYQGRQTRWVTMSKSWGVKKPTKHFLQNLRSFFNHMDTGVSTGPGGLGLTMMRKSWLSQFRLNWKAHRHQRPNWGVCTEMQEKGMGARSDDSPTRETFDWIWEIDRKNAYGADLSCPLPTGAACRFLDGMGHGDFPIFVADCLVALENESLFGFFPIRNEEGELAYPTRKGTYTTWLWSNQIAMCERHGLKVEIADGWGWRETTTDCAAFVREMECLRDAAPTRQIADWVKLCLVAAIGRLNSSPYRSFLAHDGTDAQRIADAGRALDLFLREELDTRPQSMPHWFWYVLSLGMEKLTEEAFLWKQQEMLIATNTDAVLIRKEADTSKYTEKIKSMKYLDDSMIQHLAMDNSIKSGTWQARKLLKVTLPALRHLTATTEQGEKIDKRPGVLKEGVRQKSRFRRVRKSLSDG